VVTPRAMIAGGNRLVLLAPAKVNLFLDILGKRPDGYHDLRSIVVPISVCDELTFEKTDGPIEVVCEHEGLPVGMDDLLPEPHDNLAVRAAELVKKAAEYTGGARIRIRKSIPIGGGRGGGSADAAATLHGVNTLWGCGLSVERLETMGAALGSDIPALIHGGAVCMEGRGERVSPVTTAWKPERSGGWPSSIPVSAFRRGMSIADSEVG
jgi:4-diphosphocytidyl-2-C-methyl-D-erythritol kinase